MSAVVCTEAWGDTSPLSSISGTVCGHHLSYRWCTLLPVMEQTPSGNTPCWTQHRFRAVDVKPTRKTNYTPQSLSLFVPSIRCSRLCTSSLAATMME
ncbi:hypothetical protein FKM82_008316 [Ascaphus truei]